MPADLHTLLEEVIAAAFAHREIHNGDQYDEDDRDSAEQRFQDAMRNIHDAWNRRIAALVPASEWRSIETAPKDGSEFIGYGIRYGDCGYTENEHCWTGARWSNESNRFVETKARPRYDNGFTFTHWQPLPTPPGTPARRVYTGQDVVRIRAATTAVLSDTSGFGGEMGAEQMLAFDEAIARRASEEE